MMHVSVTAKIRFILCLTLLVGCALWLTLSLARGYLFDSSVMALLPHAEQSIGKALANEQLIAVADRRLVILLEGSDESRSAEAAQAYVAALSESDLFESIDGQVSGDSISARTDFFKPWRYQLVNAATRDRLDQGDLSLVDDALAKLYSPLGKMFSADLSGDPLQLFSQWQLATAPRTALDVEQGWLTRHISNIHYRFITVELSRSAYDVAYQQSVLGALARADAALPPDIRVLKSGLLMHAAYGADRARTEISTIGIGSLSGVLALLFFCFSRLRIVLLAVLPLLAGCVVALAACILVFDRVHLITVAFGAGLVGVAIDYSLHYVCANVVGLGEQSAQNKSPLRRIFPGLCLGLFSSVLAYGAQAIAPFPGLRQMAMFSAAGLIGAWLTVVCILPVLMSGTGIQLTPSVGRFLRYAQSVWPTATSLRSTFLFLMIFILALVSIFNMTGSDDVRALQTSPISMLERDAEVLGISGGVSLSGYYVVSGQSEQQLLQREERLADLLRESIEEGGLTGYEAVSRYVPSAQVQAATRAVVAREVYAAQGMLTELVARGHLQGLDALARERFETSPYNALGVNDWLSSPASRGFRHLWIGEDSGRYYSMVTVSALAGDSAFGKMSEYADRVEGVEFVDRVADITTLLRDYRRDLGRWLCLAYGLVLLLLYIRYGRDGWRVIAAPALASVLTLCLLNIFGAPLTLFHGLALLLILGIGIDASIFLRDSRNSVDTLLAVTLSAMTTFLAFGLLAFSQVPVLHYFGQTVAVGIVLVWILSPCFVVRYVKNKKD